MRMKKLILRLLPLIILCVCMGTGCSAEKEDSPFSIHKEIVLQSLMNNSLEEDAGSTKDSVFFAKGDKSKEYTDVWKATVKSAGRTSFAEPQYYPNDDSKVYLCGYAPEAELTDNNRVAYVLDGLKDVMVTDEKDGSLTDMFWQEEKCFEFSHLLSQLRFQVCCDAEGLLKGVCLQSIIIEGTQTEATLSLTNKSLQFKGARNSIVGYEYSGGDRFGLDTDYVPVPNAIMIQPGVPVYLTITLQAASGGETRFEHLPVVFHEDDGLPLAGTSYLLSVKINTKGTVELSSVVTEWKKGDNGFGVID